MKPQSLACIVIPVHNRKQLTLECLDKLHWCADRTDWAIVVVDDGSTDGTSAAITTAHPHVHLVAGDGALYWTGGMAMGMRHAMETGASEIVWLNDDTTPNEPSLRRIIQLVRDDRKLMVASTATVKGVPVESCSLHFKPAGSVPGVLTPVDVMAGYQVAFATDVIDAIGYPDANKWPHYAGDSGYTRQAHRAGFNLCLDGDSTIELRDYIHYNSAGQVFWAADARLINRIDAMFFSKRSRFRLATSWHLDVIARGYIRSLVIFPARIASWIIDIVRRCPCLRRSRS